MKDVGVGGGGGDDRGMVTAWFGRLHDRRPNFGSTDGLTDRPSRPFVIYRASSSYPRPSSIPHCLHNGQRVPDVLIFICTIRATVFRPSIHALILRAGFIRGISAPLTLSTLALGDETDGGCLVNGRGWLGGRKGMMMMMMECVAPEDSMHIYAVRPRGGQGSSERKRSAYVERGRGREWQV